MSPFPSWLAFSALLLEGRALPWHFPLPGYSIACQGCHLSCLVPSAKPSERLLHVPFSHRSYLPAPGPDAAYSSPYSPSGARYSVFCAGTSFFWLQDMVVRMINLEVPDDRVVTLLPITDVPDTPWYVTARPIQKLTCSRSPLSLFSWLPISSLISFPPSSLQVLEIVIYLKKNIALHPKISLKYKLWLHIRSHRKEI